MSAQKFGRYEIKRPLGRGGMAVVYLAYDPVMEREVAVKVLPSHLTEDPEFHDGLKHEVQTVAKLEHPCIAPVYDYGEQDGQPYVVMRYMPGGSLLERIRQNPLTPKELSRVIGRLARALDKAHSNHIIHRDIKPGNILFDEEGEAYLADFGIAKAVQSSATKTGSATIGTPAYMSPEQGRGAKNLDGRSDVYSLGVVVFEALTGQQPFEADTPIGLVMQHLTQEIPSICEIKPNLPSDCEIVIKQAMAKVPDGRYAKAGDLAADLATIARGGRVLPRPELRGDATEELQILEEESKAAPESKPGFSSKSLVWGVLALALVATLTGILAIENGWISPPPSLAQVTIPQYFATLWVSTVSTSTLTPRDLVPIWPPPTPTTTPTNWNTVPARHSTSEQVEVVMNYIPIPAGEFTMGSSEEDTGVDEHPQHVVYLDAFLISEHEVTNVQYQKCVEVGACQPPGCDYFKDASKANHPVVCVNWEDAQAYCAWFGARLPTEAEWEKAARGTDGREYPWGDDEPDCGKANYSGCVEDTSVVGSYRAGASPYGVLDMAGNAWEWVADWYSQGYYAHYLARNPQGPWSGQYKVLRGGSWTYTELSLRTANRANGHPNGARSNIGFRCARPADTTARVTSPPATPVHRGTVPASRSTSKPFSSLAAPTLLEPPGKASFGGVFAEISFKWSEVDHPLKDNEYYVLIIKHGAGNEFIWTKEPVALVIVSAIRSGLLGLDTCAARSAGVAKSKP